MHEKLSKGFILANYITTLQVWKIIRKEQAQAQAVSRIDGEREKCAQAYKNVQEGKPNNEPDWITDEHIRSINRLCRRENQQLVLEQIKRLRKKNWNEGSLNIGTKITLRLAKFGSIKCSVDNNMQ